MTPSSLSSRHLCSPTFSGEPSRLSWPFAIAAACLLVLTTTITWAGRAGAATPPPGHGARLNVPRDGIEPARDLPPGTVEVVLRDESRRPRPGQSVTLSIVRQSPAIGIQKSHQQGTTNNEGRVRFGSLQTGSEHRYSVIAPYQGATYSSREFLLREDMGQRVYLHVIPTTTAISDQLALIAIVAAEPSDSVIKLEVVTHILNSGSSTWIPTDYGIGLPHNAKAFTTDDDSPLRYELVGDRALLKGSVTPGQHSAAFRFQIPNPAAQFFPWAQRHRVSVRLSLPPQIRQATVATSAAPGMGLIVPGFPTAQPAEVLREQPGLATTWTARSLQDSLTALTMSLTGLPVRGNAPFFSVAAAVALLGWGFAGFRARATTRLSAADLEQARRRLLDELIALDVARLEKQIGPSTYETARRRLLLALARLQTPTPPKRSKRSPKKRR